MKKLTIITIYLAITLISAACYSLDTSSVKFMPLALGNMWVYDYYTQGGVYQNSAVLRVVGDTIANSKKYYKLTGVLFGGWYRGDTLTGNLMQLGSGCHYDLQESLLDSFAMQSGNYCGNTGGRDSNRVILGVNVPTFTIQRGFGHSFLRVMYAKYIGLYESTSFLFNVPVNSYILRGARINGVVFGDTSGVTGLSPINSELPEKFSLSQNYPNPFNPATKIKFDVPKASFTKLIIYDIMGREVTTLVNEELNPGTYQADWNASNFSSGVYFYKIVSGDFVETKKMVLMK